MPFVGGVISAILTQTSACQIPSYVSAGGADHLFSTEQAARSDALTVLHVLSSLAQLTGGALFLVAFLAPETTYADGGDDVAVLPWGSPDGGGAQLLGRF